MAGKEAARAAGSSAPVSRRQPAAGHRFLSPHQAAVLDAAIDHVLPRPEGGAGGLDFPGPRVVGYVDGLLSRFGAQNPARRVRVADLCDQYTNGIALLDELAGGDFTAVPRLQQGLIVSHDHAAPFVALLIDHIVAAIYAPPEDIRRDAADPYHGTG